MDVTVYLHRPNKVTADSTPGGATWLSVENEGRDCVTIFMPLPVAQAMAAAWDAARSAARAAGRAAAGGAAAGATWDEAGATNEIQGSAVMRAEGQPFYFLPLFGFDKPEDIPARPANYGQAAA